MSKRETSLLAQFLKNPDRVLTRDLLMARIWGDNPVEGGNLDNYIYFLRKRLSTIKSDCKITTVHGYGFRLEHL